MDTPFLVNTYTDPVLVRVQGRASYLNCTPLSDFFKQMLVAGKTHFVVDFYDCKGMDSTFLGILAGLALDLRKKQSDGICMLSRLEGRNLELVQNLGLDKLATVKLEDFSSVTSGNDGIALAETAVPYEAMKSLILNAHQNLIQADTHNSLKFQDVITFLQAAH